MEIILGVSNRHIHLTEEDYKLLFNEEPLEKIRSLKQPHQFAAKQTVTIKTNKDKLENVRVIGPFRNYTQVEISKTDAYKLGINPPIRDSGDLTDSETVEIIGPVNKITRKCCITANRHIHITKQQKQELNLENLEEVAVSFEGEKGLIFDHVKLKECTEAELELHLDTDDANAGFLKTGNIGRIIKKQ